jgi:4-amino-4-deoxychorismate lyase
LSSISSADRGLHYGDGLFETISCADGQARWLDRHLARLARGCERLGIAFPDDSRLRSRIRNLATASPHGLIKLILTRGVATSRGYRPSGRERTTLLLECHPWPPVAATVFSANLSTVSMGENPLLAGIKHLNRLEQVLAQQRLAGTSVGETLMCSSSGAVICGSMSNLFLCEEAALITPAVESCGVAGVMRSLVIDGAHALRLPLQVERVSVERLRAAPAAFVTNVRLGLQSVQVFEQRPLAVDPRVSALQEWIDAHAG